MEGKLRKQSARGKQAENLLKNRLLNEAFEMIESELYEKWKATVAGEEEQRENAYLMHRMLQNFKSHFEQIVRTGKHASNLLELDKGK